MFIYAALRRSEFQLILSGLQHIYNNLSTLLGTVIIRHTTTQVSPNFITTWLINLFKVWKLAPCH